MLNSIFFIFSRDLEIENDVSLGLSTTELEYLDHQNKNLHNFPDIHHSNGMHFENGTCESKITLIRGNTGIKSPQYSGTLSKSDPFLGAIPDESDLNNDIQMLTHVSTLVTNVSLAAYTQTTPTVTSAFQHIPTVAILVDSSDLEKEDMNYNFVQGLNINSLVTVPLTVETNTTATLTTMNPSMSVMPMTLGDGPALNLVEEISMIEHKESDRKMEDEISTAKCLIQVMQWILMYPYMNHRRRQLLK